VQLKIRWDGQDWIVPLEWDTLQFALHFPSVEAWSIVWDGKEIKGKPDMSRLDRFRRVVAMALLALDDAPSDIDEFVGLIVAMAIRAEGSQVEAGKLIGMSERQVSYWVHEKGVPGIKQVGDNPTVNDAQKGVKNCCAANNRG